VGKQLGMRMSLSGVAANAADTLKRLADIVRMHADYDPEDDTQDDPAGDAAAVEFMLRELSRHARETVKGMHSLADFAGFYCLTRPGEANTTGAAP
jgi:hypothetical protein